MGGDSGSIMGKILPIAASAIAAYFTGGTSLAAEGAMGAGAAGGASSMLPAIGGAMTEAVPAVAEIAPAMTGAGAALTNADLTGALASSGGMQNPSYFTSLLTRAKPYLSTAQGINSFLHSKDIPDAIGRGAGVISGLDQFGTKPNEMPGTQDFRDALKNPNIKDFLLKMLAGAQ